MESINGFDCGIKRVNISIPISCKVISSGFAYLTKELEHLATPTPIFLVKI